jgi:hypothetical protein
MKTLVFAIILAPTTALAFDSGAFFYYPAVELGGGGIVGTGGQHDHSIKCTDCHVDRQAEPLAFSLAFSPPLTGNAYVPGQTYTVTAMLAGANLPCQMGAVGMSMKQRGFAASFETDSGTPAGGLRSAANQVAPSCALPPPNQTQPTASTVLDGDCQVIIGNDEGPSWQFTWTAPASGTVRIYWGAVDGNCDMMSMGDAAIAGSTTLAPPPMARVELPWLAQLVLTMIESLI